MFYRQVMDFWKSVLPAEKILDIHYEQPVENPEPESQRLISHCGLEWEPECLDHANDSRAVATASLWQVRQPIYKSSVKRWHRYATHLADLANGIAPYLEKEDIEFLKSNGVTVKPKRRWWSK